jgi:hypothetical protein
MGGISAYEVHVESRADSVIALKDRKITDVQGMPDVDLVVRERRRVVDVDGTTTFQIRLRNYGTKEATKLLVKARLSDNFVVTDTAGGPEGNSYRKDDQLVFPLIPRLGPGKEMSLAIKVKVTKPQPKIGTCRVFLLRHLPRFPHARRIERAAGRHGRGQGHRIVPRRHHRAVTMACAVCHLPSASVFHRIRSTSMFMGDGGWFPGGFRVQSGR